MLLPTVIYAEPADPLKSPDNRIEMEFKLSDAGAPSYLIRCEGLPVLQESASA